MKAMMMIAATLLLTSAPAFARDSLHLSCTGFMSAQPDPDNYGLAIQFDESRAEDGENREEMLSIVWASNLYQGARLNKTGEFGKNGSIVLKSKDREKSVFFKGKYNVVSDVKSGAYKLQLAGLIDLQPSDKAHAAFQKISTTLSCVDISN